MRKRILLFLLLATTGFAFCFHAADAADIKADVSLNTGYRVDNFSWNVAGSSYGINPNILSELTWSDLETLEAAVSGRLLANEWFYVRGAFGYGWTFSGDNQDSDFLGNNRTQEYSRSSNSADGGTVLDASIGAGYQFSFLSGRLRLAPLLGYSYNAQNLALNDGAQVIATRGLTPPIGSIYGLDSSYNASWLGPWLGIDLSAEITKKLTLFGTFEYHWANYRAEGNWNLRNDLADQKSFKQDADGKGYLIAVSAEYLFAESWSLNMSLSYQKWSTDPGHDHLYYANGSVAETRLNEVNWDSCVFILGVVYRFGNPPST
jgi:outer membrane protease